MTELDKKIIDIIEPYMEKDLIEGCYCINGGHLIRLSHIQDKTMIGFHFIDNKGGGLVKKDSIDEILGNYDLTAVLKYITDKQPSQNYINIICLFDIIVIGIDGKNYELPHKPINLYTEEQKQELLDLLLKK